MITKKSGAVVRQLRVDGFIIIGGRHAKIALSALTQATDCETLPFDPFIRR